MHNARLNQRAFGRRTRPFSALLVAIASLRAPTRAWGQEASTVKAASEAERAFQKAKKDYDEGRLDEACEGFAKSQHLDPSSGTLLNLAACHERQGKAADAYVVYREAARLAIKQRDEAVKNGNKNEADRRAGDAKLAIAGASNLTSKLSLLVVRGPRGVLGLAIKRCGKAIDATQFDLPWPVGPGDCAVTAELRGREYFREVVQAAAATTQEVRVPTPPDAQPPLGTTLVGRETKPRPVDETPNWRWPLGYTLGGLGVASLGVGAVFGWKALSSYAEAEKVCPERSGCAPEAVNRRDRAGTEAFVANVGLGVGVLGLAAGSYLLLTAPSRPKTSLASGRRGALVFEPRPTGFVVAGRF